MMDRPKEECDYFDCKTEKTPFMQKAMMEVKDKKWWMLGGVFFISFIGGGFFVASYYSKSSKPIVVYPVDQPLKIKPDLQIEEAENNECEEDENSTHYTKPKKQNMIYDKVIKKRERQKERTHSPQSGDDAPRKGCETVSYYVCLGHYSSHYEASMAWKKIKGEHFEELKDVEPIVRVVPSDQGKNYQLLAGPIDKQKGLKLGKEFKTTLLSVDS